MLFSFFLLLAEACETCFYVSEKFMRGLAMCFFCSLIPQRTHPPRWMQPADHGTSGRRSNTNASPRWSPTSPTTQSCLRSESTWLSIRRNRASMTPTSSPVECWRTCLPFCMHCGRKVGRKVNSCWKQRPFNCSRLAGQTHFLDSWDAFFFCFWAPWTSRSSLGFCELKKKRTG